MARSLSLQRSLVGLATWWVVLAGLLAMHGLSTHGTGAHHDLAMAGSERTTQAAHSMQPMPAAAEPPSGSSVALGAPSGSDTGHDPMTLCLAVMAGALIWLASVLRRRSGWRRLRDDVRRLVGAVSRSGRERDPPCLTRLSVLRC